MFDRQSSPNRPNRTADVITWFGLALIVIGLILAGPTLAPFVMSRAQLYTESDPPSVATLSPISTPAPSATPTPHILMPAFDLSEDAPTPEPTPATEPATALPIPTGFPPTRIVIPEIGLDAPVVPIGWEVIENGGVEQAIWKVPAQRAAGWHDGSAPLGLPGNTVLNGHNTGNGEVFRDLYLLEPGDHMTLYSGQTAFEYRIIDRLILPEAGQPLEVRISNAQYIQRTEDERVTLVTCHPYNSLRYRLVIIARPAEQMRSGNDATLG
jgi:sortase A